MELRHDRDRPRRVLFISTNDGVVWGGSEELWGQAALRLVEGGWHVTVCARHWPQPACTISRLRLKGAVMLLRRTPGVTRRLLRRFRQMVTGREWSAFSAALNAGPFDLVVISNGGTVPIAHDARAIIASGYPFMNICQANREEFFVDDGQLESIQHYAKSARAMVFVSRANQELFESQTALRLNNAVVVRNPYGVSFENQCAPARYEDGRPLRFACVGRLHPPSKGQDLLIAALSQAHWLARDWSLVFAGAGPFRVQLQRLAELHGIGDRVEFLGHVDDIGTFWTSHDVLVLPSRYEGLPLALVEAMLCARVVVTTRVAGAPELVLDGANGFLADVPSSGAVGEALDRAYAARSQWTEISEAARRSARQFSSNDPVGRFAALIESHVVTRQEPE